MSVTRNYGVYYAPTGNANTEAKTVALDMASGNQFIDSNYGTYLASVTVTKPATFLPENIKKNINIGGVIGTYEGLIPSGNYTCTGVGPFNVGPYATASVQECVLAFDQNPTSVASTLNIDPPTSANDGLFTVSIDTGTRSITPTSFTKGWLESSPTAKFRVQNSASYKLSTIEGQTIIPTTSNQTLAAGNYLTGTQTILGDANLIPENIVEDVSIFGVTGNALISHKYYLSSLNSTYTGNQYGATYSYFMFYTPVDGNSYYSIQIGIRNYNNHDNITCTYNSNGYYEISSNENVYEMSFLINTPRCYKPTSGDSGTGWRPNPLYNGTFDKQAMFNILDSNSDFNQYYVAPGSTSAAFDGNWSYVNKTSTDRIPHLGETITMRAGKNNVETNFGTSFKLVLYLKD